MKKVIVRSNIKKTMDFLNDIRSGVIKKKANEKIIDSIKTALTTNVYINRLITWNVPDKDMMRDLIKRRRLPSQNTQFSKYYEWKQWNGGRPHEVTGQMKNNTFIEEHAGKVLFFIPSSATTRTSRAFKVSVYDFGPIHERRKSVLKSTMVFAWQDIMKKVTNLYREHAER